MSDRENTRRKAENLWEAFTRKLPPIAKAAELDVAPALGVDRIGGLADAKDEILTFACAATDPEVYQRWGTAPPSGLLLIGPAGSGKSMLAEALATRADTPFLSLRVPRLVLQIARAGDAAGAVLEGWVEMLSEMPRVTVFFREVDFRSVETLAGRRPDLPVPPVMDFLLEFLDQTIAAPAALVIGSTSHPDKLSPLFLEPGRFERVVSVEPEIPADVVAALTIHASAAEQRAGRPLFESVDWTKAVERSNGVSIADWVRCLHAVLRRKARADAAGDEPGFVGTEDVLRETERHSRTAINLPSESRGTYL